MEIKLFDKLTIGKVYKVSYFGGNDIHYSYKEKIEYTGNSFNFHQQVLLLGVKEDLEKGCHIFKFLISNRVAYVFFSSEYVDNKFLKFVEVK